MQSSKRMIFLKLKYITSDKERTNCTFTLLLFKVQNICVAQQKRKDTYHITNRLSNR